MRKIKNVWKMLCACLCIGMAAFAFSACSIGIDSEGKLYIKPNNQYVENLDESTEGKCAHVWNEGTVISSATCTEVGQKLSTCEICHFTRMEDIPALGHNFYEDAVLVVPTCVEKGLKLYSCYNGCSGYTAEMDMLEHSYTDVKVTKEATCQSVGERTFTCVNGCYGTTTEELPILNHDYSFAAIILAPTCMEEGLQMRACVNGCWDTFTESVPTIPHVYDDGVITLEPTCTELGIRTHSCTYGCGTTKDADVPALGHAYDAGKITTAPTCTKLGVKTFTCIRGCGKTYTEDVDMIPHVYDDGVVTKEPNCTELGVLTFSCIYGCGDSYTEDIPVRHYYDDGVITTPPTCTETGIKTFTCTMNCGEAYTEIVPALGHTYDNGVITIEPTCEEWGVKTFTCVNGCGYSYITDVSPLGHTYDSGVVTQEPTCTEWGVMTFTCVNGCGNSYTTDISPLGHSYDDGVVTTEPTCTEPGEKLYSCVQCDNESYTESLPALGHDYVRGVCSRCGELKASEGLAYVLNADYASYKVTGIGSCTDTDIVIPAYYNGYPVTTIAPSAFLEQMYLTSLAIPDTVVTIGESAFYGAMHLTRVILGENVASIGNYAFVNCYNLVEVYNKSSLLISAGFDTHGQIALFAKNVYTATEGEGKLTFDENGGIVYQDGNEVLLVGYSGQDAILNVPETVTEITQYSLYGLDYITAIVVGDALTTVGGAAFYAVDGLTAVYYQGTPADWTNVVIGDNNTALTNATVYCYSETEPSEGGNWWHYVDGEIAIWKSASVGLSYSFNSSTLSYKVTGMGSCTDTDLVIPAYYNGYPVTAIGNAAFYNQDNLVSVSIPDTVIYIYDDAFESCNSLQTVILGAGVQYINYDAFYSCNVLSTVYYKGTYTNWNNISFGSYNGNLTNATRYYYSETEPSEGGAWWHYVDGEPTIWTGLSFGLSYSWNSSTSSYTVTGMGNCADSYLVIPAYYNGYPVTAIGNSAFDYCTSLVSVSIPDTVKYIYDDAFDSCTALQTVILGAGVQQINYDGFYNCGSIAQVFYKGTLESWNNISFGAYNSSLINATRYYYSETQPTEAGNWWYYQGSQPSVWNGGSAGLSYVLDGSSYTVSKGTFSGTELVIPAYYNGYPVTAIGSSGFYNCSSLISVTIPDTVTDIYSDAFESCTSLQTVILGAGVQSVNYDSFYNCGAISTVYYKGTPETWNSIWFNSYNSCLIEATRYYYSETAPTQTGSWWHYDDGAIAVWSDVPHSLGLSYGLNGDGQSYEVQGIGSCTDTDLIIPAYHNGLPVTSIGYDAFYNSSLTSVVIPDTVTYIGSEAFEYNYSLKWVCFGSSVTWIDYDAFNECSMLSMVYYKGTQSDWNNTSIDSWNTPLLNAPKYYYSEIASTNGDWWYFKDGVPTVWVNGSVGLNYTWIAGASGYAVADMGTCTDTEIVIPAYVGNYPVVEIANSAFAGNNITSVVIPDTVTYINSYAFNGCSYLERVILPASVETVSSYAFYNCGMLTSVYYKGNSSDWSGVYFDSTNYSLTSATIYYFTEYTPNENGNWWHYVSGEPTVWEINYSLGLAYSLNSDGESYTVTGMGNCTDTDLIIPAAYNGYPVTSIGDWAFYNCDGLLSIEIPDSVTSIGGYAFTNCDGLTSIEIPNSVTFIGEGVFCDCPSLKSVVIPNRLTSIAYIAFASCPSLKSVVIPDGVTSIGESAFSDCSDLSIVYYKGSESEWGNISIYSGNDCLTGATRYYYSETKPEDDGNDYWRYVDGVPTPWRNSSRGLVYNLNSDGVSYTVTGMGTCTDTDLIIPAYYEDYPVTVIGASAFYGKSSIINLTIPDTVMYIYDDAFDSCTSLKTVILGAGVQQINYDGFWNCGAISAVYYKGTESDWNNISFGSYNSSLTNATRYYYSEEPTSSNWWCFGYNDEILKGAAVSTIVGNSSVGSTEVCGSLNVSSTQSTWYKFVAPYTGSYTFYLSSGEYASINVYYELITNLPDTADNITISMTAGETYYIEVFGTSASTYSDTLYISGPGLTTADAIVMGSDSSCTITIPAGCYVWVKTNTTINYNDYCYFSSDNTVSVGSYYQSGTTYYSGYNSAGTSFTIDGYTSSYYTYYYRLYASVDTTVTVYLYI